MSISKAAKAAYDRERYVRLGPRQQTRDRAAKAEYDRKRRAERYTDQRPTICKAEGCDRTIQQPKRGRRLFCSDACRSAHFYGYAPSHAEARQPMPKPYTGHRWLEMAREAAGGDRQLELGLEAYDRYTDEMGEALLALLEGRDAKSAVIEFRRREYVPRYRTTHFSEWAGEEESWRLDRALAEHAPVESAEDEVVARDTVRRRLPRIHMGASRGFMGTPRQQQPSQRRQRVA